MKKYFKERVYIFNKGYRVYILIAIVIGVIIAFIEKYS